MESEVRGLVNAMTVVAASGSGPGFAYWRGELGGQQCVVARCGMGKVSAAAGVQRLVDVFGVDRIVVCGLAGGLKAGLRRGDIVVGERFLQYDLDASPIFPKHFVPGLDMSYFAADREMVSLAEVSSREVARSLAGESGVPTVYRGLIVTGDQFVDGDAREQLVRDFPDAVCVEMEGGAVAQVCYLNSVPFVIVRVISDDADADAAGDFLAFVNDQAPRFTVGIVEALLKRLPRRSQTGNVPPAAY
jgi:adenosylhomocysteine nucleosidase